MSQASTSCKQEGVTPARPPTVLWGRVVVLRRYRLSRLGLRVPEARMGAVGQGASEGPKHKLVQV